MCVNIKFILKNAFTYSWKFGDGETSTQTSPTHTYLANGSYDVQLSAAGDGGNNSLTKTIVIPLQ
ncbi:MAG: PKD domain-containing protein [Saprospiraceae bacterium]|nr:PKD domain-containing protein [Saprospiraceae bacterium]